MSEKIINIPRPEHPEPQWERNNWVNLNGEWQFCIDHGVSGKDRGLHLAEKLDGRITVPFCPESKLSGVEYKDFMLQVWYKRGVSFNKSELCGKRVLLHFGAADFETTVYINGKQAGKPHVGGQTPFMYDITKLIIDGENVITVCCYDDTRDSRQYNGKQCTSYKSRVCHYTRTTGIWQTVWYEIVPKSYIRSAKFDTDIENGTVSVSASLIGSGDLSAEVYYEGKKVGEGFKRNQSVTSHMEIALSETHLWEVGQGRLYDIVLRFGEDKVKSYFGMRHVEMKDGKFYLNGKSVFQRLVLDQGFYPDGIWTAPAEEDLKKDIELGIEAGFNGARLHQKVFEPRSLYYADKLGYLIWRECGDTGINYSDMSVFPAFLQSWLDSVDRDYNHPSVVVWCPINETWDRPANQLRSRADPMFARTAYEETKRHDPSRPCIDTSGLYHVVTDIFDVHDYEDAEAFKVRYAELESGVVNNKYSDRQTWKGEPFMISEFGGIGYRLEHNDRDTGKRITAWCHKNVWSPEEFYASFKAWVDILLDNPKICGYCYTQLTDIEQEQNGFFSYDRTLKVPLAPLREIQERKAAVED